MLHNNCMTSTGSYVGECFDFVPATESLIGLVYVATLEPGEGGDPIATVMRANVFEFSGGRFHMRPHTKVMSSEYEGLRSMMADAGILFPREEPPKILPTALRVGKYAPDTPDVLFTEEVFKTGSLDAASVIALQDIIDKAREVVVSETLVDDEEEVVRVEVPGTVFDEMAAKLSPASPEEPVKAEESGEVMMNRDIAQKIVQAVLHVKNHLPRIGITSDIGPRNIDSLFAAMSFGDSVEKAFETTVLNHCTPDKTLQTNILTDNDLNTVWNHIKSYTVTNPLTVDTRGNSKTLYMDEKKARKLVSDDFLTRELTEEELALVPKIYESHIPSQIENTVVSHVLRSKHGRYPIKNVLLEGDSGTGKTHMVKMIAARLGAPYVAFTCGAETDKYELEKTLQPMTGDEGQLLFEDILSPILVGFERGYVVEVQEPNVILSPGILSKLNSILETDGFYDYNGRVIPRHPDFLCFFTMNKETYEGVHELNQAVKQRFQEVYVVDMPSVDELTKRAASINAIKLV